MSKHKIVIGCQWGDEGKGKITDLLAADVDIIARSQGGANAGHTIVVGDTTYKFRLMPTGILHEDKTCVIGNGVVLDPWTFREELEMLESHGISYDGRLFISPATNLVMPFHRLIDAIEDKRRGTDAIGTTARGIGPAYVDKVARNGIRISDLYTPDRLRKRLDYHKKIKEAYLEGSTDERADIDKTFEELMDLAPLFKPMVRDISLLLQQADRAGKTILYEGAQGTMLDVDLGTYPFATSSNTTVGGTLTGLGIGPKMVGEVVGVVKAYCTRVGAGPFPTELIDDTGDKLREVGGEFGTVTGRPRRCGWLDLVALRHAVRINGVDSIAVTKLDVLDDFAELKVCTEYELNGQRMSEVPLDLADLSRVKPIYKSVPGWMSDSSGKADFDELPEKAQAYLRYIAEDLGVKIKIVSTGANRVETIMMA